jgi:hypothetical protein
VIVIVELNSIPTIENGKKNCLALQVICQLLGMAWELDWIYYFQVEVEALVIQGPKLATILSQVKKLEVSVLVLSQYKSSPFCWYDSSLDLVL